MWFITVMEKRERYPSEKKYPSDWIDHGCLRTWGYYYDHDMALRTLHENWTDMWEGCYHYAVLEEIGEGIYPMPKGVQWFKYDRERDGYFEIEIPEGENPHVSLVIG